MTDNRDRVVGIIKAKDRVEAENILHKHYDDWENWLITIKEIDFNSEIIEIYYGG
jgi:hypothetical protein